MSSDSIDVEFEGFFIRIDGVITLEELKIKTKELLGNAWIFEKIGIGTTKIEVTNKFEVISVREAWNRTYKLRKLTGVVDVEPLFKLRQTCPQNAVNNDKTTFLGAIFSILKIHIGSAIPGASQKYELESRDHHWALKFMKVLKAWKDYFPDPYKLPGFGITIALPDTGSTSHPELIDNLLSSEGYDFVSELEDCAADPLEKVSGEIINNPGHGTVAASVLVSPPGPQAAFEDGDHVTGVAPGAKIVPLRVTHSVALLSTRNLSRAIEYAADKGFHIISISLGTGLPSKRLRSAIKYAHKRGVIIVAASGTFTPYVIFPAAYDEIIAVGGCTIGRKMWIGSPRGSKLDVIAPSHNVWHARTLKTDNDGENYIVEQGSGTSLAAPLVAGIAAMWLSHHGRDNLIEKYGAGNLPIVFKHLICNTCDTPADWNTKMNGSGFVDAHNLLSAELPELSAIESESGDVSDGVSIDTFVHLFGMHRGKQFVADTVKRVLCKILKTTDEKLSEKLAKYGDELAFYFVTSRRDIFFANGSWAETAQND